MSLDEVEILTAKTNQLGTLTSPPTPQRQRSSRATRLVDDPSRFLHIAVHRKVPDDRLRERLAQWIHDGIDVDGVHYAFLGFSDNHLKNGRIVFFREDHQWTVPDLFKVFGDLQSVYLDSGYGKYCARLSLSFSGTRKSLDVPKDQALQLADHKAADGSYHSDGCGMIRDSFAAQLCHEHKLPGDTSVFQIRRGGIKGLLVRYPDVVFDSICRRSMPRATRARATHTYLIAYRPSMHKYANGPTELELNSHSSFAKSARLNASFILLLYTLGVPFEVFERLLKDQLDLIGSILHDREKAEQLVKGELDAADTSYHQDLYALLLSKHDLSEPHVAMELRGFQNQQYKTLREKLSFTVEDSCYVYGVVDEYGVLAEDEVFINLPGRTGVLVRDVIVGRNPSYLSSDLRKFRAVHKEELTHLSYCIVFSRKAAHSVPDTMASGDLDGDTYFVTWDPTLIPPNIRPVKSRQATATVPSARIVRHIDNMEHDAVETFMEHKFGMLLGQMATSWKEAAQTTPALVDAPHVVELAELIETSHDILKSGRDPVKLRADFHRWQSRQRSQQRNAARGFISPLQRLIDIIPPPSSSKQTSFECDPVLVEHEGCDAEWEQYIDEARRFMSIFNRQLQIAIEEDKEDEDAELPAQRSREKERHPKKTDMRTQEWRARYFGGGSRQDRLAQSIRASAWYYYGYQKKKAKFAWLGERYLNETRAYYTNGNKPILYVGTSMNQITGAGSVVVDVSTPLTAPTEIAPSEASQSDVLGTRSLVDPDEDRCVCVRTNPHPAEPVATSPLPSCTAHRRHAWQVTLRNRNAQHYVCTGCQLYVTERHRDGHWATISHRVMTADGDAGTHLAPSRHHASALGSSGSSGGDDEFDDSTSTCASDAESDGAYFSAEEDDEQEAAEAAAAAPPDGERCSALEDTLSVGDLSELASIIGLPAPPQLPVHDDAAQGGPSAVPPAREDVATRPAPLVRSPTNSSVVSSISSVTSSSSAATASVFVAENPKPLCPVATQNTRRCTTGTGRHIWRVSWAGATQRHYACDCGVLVKERKEGDPQVWTPLVNGK